MEQRRRSVVHRWRAAAVAFATAAVLVTLAGRAAAQQYDGIAKDRAASMLQQVYDEIKKKYYDPSFHGMDIDAHFKQAREQLAEAKSYNEAISIIANAVTAMDDSHTYFDPPTHTTWVDYGWRDLMVGDECYVSEVRPGSDAEAKGLKRGDRVLFIEGYRPSRENLWKITYNFYVLNRGATLRVVVQAPGGEPRAMDVAARIKTFPRVQEPLIYGDLLDPEEFPERFREKNGVVIWQMSSFELPPETIDDLMQRKVRDAKALVLDLRGNPGGSVKTLERFTSYFFNRELKIADRKGRKKFDPIVAKKRGWRYKGKLIVVIDSDSGSAAEMFARVVQLESRGIVIGDRSAGAVMQSETYEGKTGSQAVVFFYLSLTNANVIMGDGKSLEKVGVTPDELVLPTVSDLAADRDPVLSRAVALAGDTLSPEAARRLFPYRWPR